MRPNNYPPIAVILSILSLFIAEAIAQYDPEYALSVDRTNSVFHKSGYNVFNEKILRHIGGVISQVDQLNDQSGNQATVLIFLELVDTYPGHFEVCTAEIHGGNLCNNYRVRYADLVPMALFVDSGGTSLYTWWEDDRLPDDFRSDAGFIKHSSGGHVALEFGETRFAEALSFIDTCVSCVMRDASKDSLASMITANIPKETHNRVDTERDEYGLINTEVGLSYGILNSDNRIIVDGGIGRFYWVIPGDSSKEIKVDLVKIFVHPDELLAQAEIMLTNYRKKLGDIKSREESGEELEDQNNQSISDNYLRKYKIDLELAIAEIEQEIEMGEKAPKFLADANFLFETLALLRTARKKGPQHWSNFMQTLRSKELVKTHPEPWKLYKRSFCSVYPENSACTE